MGVIFWLFGYISGYLAIVVLALALSAGLYMLAELAEEHLTLTGKIVKTVVVVVAIVQLLLWIDGMPTFESLIGLGSTGIYASMMVDYPYMKLVSPSSIGSVVAFIASNLLFLKYFTANHNNILHVFGYFVVLVWSIPCGLFVSLTVNDNTLPSVSAGIPLTSNNGLNSGSSSGKSRTIIKLIYDATVDFLKKLNLQGNITNVVKSMMDKNN